MEQLRREDEEKREAEAEQEHEEKIRQIRESCPERVEQYIQRENELHLENIRKIDVDLQNFISAVDEMKASEASEHEKRKAELLEKMRLKLAGVSKKCDYVTQAALDNLERAFEKLKKEIHYLETENSYLLEKNIEFEIQLEQRVFAEVTEIKSKHEKEAREYAEAISQLIADQLKEKQAMLAEERAVMEKNAAAIIAVDGDNLVEQEKYSNLLLIIQQSAEEAKNRHIINAKIMEMKNYLQDLEMFYERVISVLGTSPEKYALFSPRVKETARSNLIRFGEVLDNIDQKLSEIEQDLANLKLANVDLETTTRAIKTQISSFSEFVSGLKTISSLEVVPNETKSKEFIAAQEELSKQINEMKFFGEKRGVQTIDQL
uniref:Growth arrest-specific protein 8 n=1 Tax=Caenorhabditis tropicalis TaxID=1561998 RepID=A0A1I7SZ17_9PELO